MSCTVYGLHDALGDLRYVGQTSRPLWKRLAEHVVQASADDPRPVLRWLWEVYSAGGTATIAPLKLNARKGDERLIIARLLGEGVPLLNVDHTPRRAAIAREVAARPGVRENRSKASTAAMTPERRAQVSATFKGKPKSPEWKARMSVLMKRRADDRRRALLGFD